MSSYVVTGASRGIGFEFISQLSSDGKNTVFAIVRNKATATKLNDLPRKNIIVLEADITDPKALKAAASEVSKVTGGKLDYLINNAASNNSPGVTLSKFYADVVFSPTTEALEEDLLTNFRVNVMGTIYCTNAFLPLLQKGSAKKVISLSSGLGDLDLTLQSEGPGQASYSIAKAALNMAVAKYAVEYKGEGFVFLSISPGIVNTATAPPTPQQLDEMQMLMKAVGKIAPAFKGPITPEESVKMQLDVIHKWTVEETGAFISHFGNKQWL
ncbi:hypothetical protein B0H10DRAFT_2179110 [Mycena sp. CBHHK59/15]|nr:hypothetical protein B0H10DRAFT_2179110 [Mycena sp. CBHHK59/15]